MSQEKVQKYKEEKANRAKLLKREKRMHALRVVFYSLIACVVIGFLGFSFYDQFIKEEPTSAVLTEEELSSLMAQLAASQSTQVVTDKNGETVTEVVTTDNGETVTDESGKTVTQAVTELVTEATTEKGEEAAGDDTTAAETTSEEETTSAE